MTAQEILLKLKKQFLVNDRQLSLMLGISMLRIDAMIKGSKPTRYELVKLGRALKIKRMIERPMSIKEIVDEQKSSITKTKERIISISAQQLHARRCYEISEYIDHIVVDAMYLGLLYANDNEDEVVLEKVKEIRKP